MAIRVAINVLAFVAMAGPIAGSTDGHAAAFNYPWCANYMMQNGPKNCGFVTLEQCRATVSGIGGYCGANPAYVVPAPPQRPRRVRRGQPT